MRCLIAGLPFTAHSPSLLTYGRTAIAFDSRAWRVATHQLTGWQWGQREFRNREAAAELIRDCFADARENLG